MLEIYDLPAASVGVMASLGALALGYPIWALVYAILGFGVEIYLKR